MAVKEKFKFLDHPADLKIQAFGQDLPELFNNAALAMMTFLYSEKAVKDKNSKAKEKIKLAAKDLKALLVDWLSELLYLSDSNDFCYNNFDFKKLTEQQLVATVYGKKARAIKDIKAVTYHDLEINQTKDGILATILFDI